MTTNAHSLDLLWQPGVPEPYFRAAENALRNAVASLGIADRLPVCVVGTHGDIDRVLAAAREVSACAGRPGQANGDVVSVWLHGRRWRPPSWKGIVMLVVNDDIGFHGDEFIFGQSDDSVGGLVSTFRFARDGRVTDRLGLFETLVMHELGHAIGAANPKRDNAIQEWFGPHCTNPCVMRQRDDLPDFETAVLPALHGGQPFCEQCRLDVTAYFNREHP